MSNKKVFYVAGPFGGCNYVRCFLPMLSNGWLGNHMGIATKLKDPTLVMNEMMASDIIVFHRADTAEHHRIGMMMKGLGKKIVFDNDDTFKIDKNHGYYGVAKDKFDENVRLKNNVINNFILNSDLVTCSTEFLAKEYREINPNVVVLPNCVNPDDWDEIPLRNEGEKIRIGVVGSTLYYNDFDIIRPLLKELDEDPRVQLVMFGLHNKKTRDDNKLVVETHGREYDFWDTLKNVEHVGWVDMEDYFTTLNELRLDIMLIPRRENDFNRAKSNVKFLEASMLEIPVIASSFEDGPYEKDINGKNGILIKNNEGWMDAINTLINDKDKRREMGRLAHEYVLKNYSIEENGWRWEEAYSKLFK